MRAVFFMGSPLRFSVILPPVTPAIEEMYKYGEEKATFNRIGPE
jgi:hypothetical protein